MYSYNIFISELIHSVHKTSTHVSSLSQSPIYIPTFVSEDLTTVYERPAIVSLFRPVSGSPLPEHIPCYWVISGKFAL